jgi:CzcA family heavy metal efflux pump
MFNKIIKWSLDHTNIVVLLSFIVIAGGIWSFSNMKVDVLPDINKPTVAVFTEGEGMSAEDIEKLILVPVESAVSGAPGVTRVRSTASFGLAIVNAEFEWGSDIFRNRQIIQERLSRLELPNGARPVLGPVGSILGEVMWIGVTSNDPNMSGMDLRTLADWTVRPALLRVPGVSDIIVLGGDVKEWQIQMNAIQMKNLGISIEDIASSITPILNNKSGGLLVEKNKEYPIRIMVAPREIADLQNVVVGKDKAGGTVRLADVAAIIEGPSLVRGAATIDGKPGVIMRISRQPDAETLKVTASVDEALVTIGKSLPAGVKIQNDLFRQQWFIDSGINNVNRALAEGIIFVILIVSLFLMNWRITFITLTAIPVSILVSAMIFKLMGVSVNVMTLGGIAIAIGELVDDAIVGVENVHHRLSEWREKGLTTTFKEVIFNASSEVRNSIVYATLLVVVVFLPVFFIPGVEGKLLSSIGIAYLISLVASLIVSLTLTPALSALLLKNVKGGNHGDTKLVAKLKTKITPYIYWSINNVKKISIGVLISLVIAVGLYSFAGKEGIPPFNESSLTISVTLPVGTDLNTSNTFASVLEKEIGKVTGVARVSHITGRAGADPHDSGANTSEIQVIFKQGLENKVDELSKQVQSILDLYKGADYALGKPITHKVEESLSGVRAPIVMKVFGDDLDAMKETAQMIKDELAKQDGVKNPQIQKEVIVPEFRIYLDTNRLGENGVSAGNVADTLEEGLLGKDIGQVQKDGARINVVLRFDQSSKGNATALRDLSLPIESLGSLSDAGDIKIEGGRNKYSHEGGKRVINVTANYQGKDIVGAVENVKKVMDTKQLKTGITISYEGTYKSQKENSTRLAWMFLIALGLIFGILFYAFRKIPIVLQVMLNIPTVFIGGIVAIWLTGGVINLAHTVGFISLAGIVSRNGILLIERCLSKAKEAGKLTKEVVVEATIDRLVPVLMTSMVTALALVPLMLAAKEPGKELLHPLAVVIFGGLVSSTIISIFLTPAVFYFVGTNPNLLDPVYRRIQNLKGQTLLLFKKSHK